MKSTLEELRCAKCNSPFEKHHWQHYSPREDKTYHTGCFEQYKFPSILSLKEAEVREEVYTKGNKAGLSTGYGMAIKDGTVEIQRLRSLPHSNKNYSMALADIRDWLEKSNKHPKLATLHPGDSSTNQ